MRTGMRVYSVPTDVYNVFDVVRKNGVRVAMLQRHMLSIKDNGRLHRHSTNGLAGFIVGTHCVRIEKSTNGFWVGIPINSGFSVELYGKPVTPAFTVDNFDNFTV